MNTKELLQTPDLIKQICDNVSNGGSIIDLCETWQVRYCDLIHWINDDNERKSLYVQAMTDRGEWFVQRVLKEINALAFRNVETIYDENHNLKPVKDWPKDVIAALDEIEVTELFNEFGKPIGQKKKAKFAQKLKALEMLGKNMFMFVEKKVVMTGEASDSKFRDEFFGLGKKQGSTTTGATKIL